jgi:hypothetical protein
MLYVVAFLALVGSIQAQVPGLGFGPVYMMQQTSSYLVEYSTILHVPNPPESTKGLVVIWPGINTDANPTNLIQTCIGAAQTKELVETFSHSPCSNFHCHLAHVSSHRSYCVGERVAANQWCAFTSTNIAINSQSAGEGIAVDGGKDLYIHCSYFSFVGIWKVVHAELKIRRIRRRNQKVCSDSHHRW